MIVNAFGNFICHLKSIVPYQRIIYERVFIVQKQPLEVFYEKILKNFAKFPGKHLCQSLFFKKVPGWGLHLKRDSGNFAKF